MTTDANEANHAALERGEGTKFDGGKLQFSLLADDAVELLVRVLMFGAKKYAPGNWSLVREWRERYYDALQRHLAKWRAGELDDPETGLPHTAAVFCNAMFLCALDWRARSEKARAA